MKIVRIADVEDTKFVFRQEVKGEERELVFDPEKCSGCMFCVYACPVNAVEFSGYEMLVAGMPLIIDHNTCCFCGICYALCPERAFSFKPGIDLRLAGRAKKLDECVNCRVCYEVCPAKAVDVKVKTVDEFHRRECLDNPDMELKKRGTLKIDPDKCRLCGKCTLFCDALVPVQKDVTPANPHPFSEILFREDRCDYCGLCEKVCPNEAITVENSLGELYEDETGIVNKDIEEIEENLKEVVKIEINEKCIECGLCVKACPYDGVALERSFSGEILVNWKRLKKVCDWESCRLCLNVCKSGAWYVEGGELKLDPDLCRFCRACMYACPEKLIEVRLHDVRVECEWKGFMKAVNRILNEEIAGVGRKIGAISVESVKTGSVKTEDDTGLKCEISDRNEIESESENESRERMEEKIGQAEDIIKVEKLLKNPSYKRLFELRPEKFLELLS